MFSGLSHLQVDVEESQLAGFLKTATGLQIKGLSEDHKPRVRPAKSEDCSCH